MAHVSEFKKKVVEDITKLSKEYPIIGVVNMESLPAPQLQAMRSELRGKVEIFMTKKRLMKIALEKIKNDKKGIEELENHLHGMPALIFTKDSPFKLSKILKKSKAEAPAKAGQIAPKDIVVPAGPTPFAPGPVISELSSVGLPVGVEGGKVAVKEDTVVAKAGEKIEAKVAEILTRLDIKPMEVGLGLVVAYEDGIIYKKDVLDIDDQEYIDNVNLAASQAFNLAFNVTYVTNDNAPLLIGKAFNDAKALGISQEIFAKGIVEDLLGKAERSMLGLKDSANLEIIETSKPEAKPAEKVPEKPKEEPKKVEKVAEEKPKEEVKVTEPIKETPSQVVKEESQQVKVEKTPEPVKEEKKPEPKVEEEKDIKEKMDDVDKKVADMVEKTKKFMSGNEPSADDILQEIKKQEEKPSERKETPSAHDLLKKKQETEEKKDVPSAEDLQKQKEEKEMEEVEKLTKELIEKGTLRKK